MSPVERGIWWSVDKPAAMRLKMTLVCGNEQKAVVASKPLDIVEERILLSFFFLGKRTLLSCFYLINKINKK